MSKVKIQGNASGTGVLTVTAPNTSTDRVITLPDSTDTLAVNSDVTNKLPLAGGTLTGNLIAGVSVESGSVTVRAVPVAGAVSVTVADPVALGFIFISLINLPLLLLCHHKRLVLDVRHLILLYS